MKTKDKTTTMRDEYKRLVTELPGKKIKFVFSGNYINDNIRRDNNE